MGRINWGTVRTEPGDLVSMRTSENTQKDMLHQEGTRQISWMRKGRPRTGCSQPCWARLGPESYLAGMQWGTLRHLWVVGLVVVDMHSSLEVQ